MSRCHDYQTGRLDLDLDDEVSRSDLADCLESGWTADEIADELGLDDAGEVARWCAYHDLPAPRVAASLPPPAAASVLEVRKEARKRVSKAGTTPPKAPAPTPKKGRKRASKAEAEARRLAANARTRERRAAKRAEQAEAERLKKLAGAERDAEIAKLYAQGQGSHTISKALKISPSTVLTALARQGVELRVVSKAERNARIVEMHKAGSTTPEIAAAHQISRGVVCEVIKRAGLKTARQLEAEARADREAGIIRVAVWAMRGAGADVAQIARLMRMDREQVNQLLEAK